LLKIAGTAVLALIAALVLGFGRIGMATHTAHADTTGISVVGCELLASAVDGDLTDTIDATTDYTDLCGIGGASVTPADITNLANTLGDQDGKLEKSDLADVEGLDANQVGEECTVAVETAVSGTGVGCTLDVFVFVDDEAPVTLDNPEGLTSIQSPGTTDFTCNTDGAGLGQDNDCQDTGTANGDGVVVFQLAVATGTGGAARGDVKTVNVTQESVAQSDDVNVVGVPHDVSLALAESTIGTNGSTANTDDCTSGTDVTDAITPPTSTLAVATVTDQDDRKLTRILLDWSVDPASATPNIIDFGVGDQEEQITGNTAITVQPNTASAPVAAYIVVCGGKSTGSATVVATINLVDETGQPLGEDNSRADITVVGAPANLAATAAPATIKCDGTETSTVTVHVTDSAGNDVADGTPVNFSVVALGTANPINTTTLAGSASTTVTPLSNSSAGVTVIITAGDSSIAQEVQTSIRVDCALPLATQPTPAPPAPAPTATGRIGGPDTGNGGYLGTSDSGFPMWALLVLGLGSLTLVAGGAVARRAGK
jgi:hypothetical protein